MRVYIRVCVHVLCVYVYCILCVGVLRSYRSGASGTILVLYSEIPIITTSFYPYQVLEYK